MNQAKIVLIDDDINFTMHRQEYLITIGFEVIIATNIDEVNQVLSIPDIDLIILSTTLENILISENRILSIPKIILSDPSIPWQYVRNKFQYESRSLHVMDIISKDLSNEEMLISIDGALNKISHMRYRTSENQKIFVVYGHDIEAKLTVKYFLLRLGLEPIVFDELPTDGFTIIELIEHHSNVGFVVALLTPDDEARAKKDEPDTIRDRARQNVIFEMGYFMGRLDRQKVRALRKGDVEMLSDFHGVLCITMENDWKWQLALDIKNAGLDANLNWFV